MNLHVSEGLTLVVLTKFLPPQVSSSSSSSSVSDRCVLVGVDNNVTICDSVDIIIYHVSGVIL